MNSKKTFQSDNINYLRLFQIFWEEKFLIIFFTSLLTILSFLYANNIKKEYKSEITIQSTPYDLFFKYKKALGEMYDDTVSSYNREFLLNLTSIDNIEEFMNTNKEFSNFLEIIKENNIPVQEYFKGTFRNVEFRGKKVPNQYELIFDNKLDGQKFLDQFVVFVKNKMRDRYISRIKDIIEVNMLKFKSNLKIAEYIKQKRPLLKEIFDEDDNRVFTEFNEPASLYFQGSVVLSSKVAELEEIVSSLEVFDYNPILSSASVSVEIPKNFKIFIFLGIIIGFLLSLGIIFFKRNIR